MGIVAFADIQDFVADVAREFLPEKVILFGSYATGSAKSESDVDLLVVMPEDVSGVRVAVDIITRLKPTLPVELGDTILNSKGGQLAAFAVSIYLPTEYHVPLPVPCCSRYPY